MQIIPGRVMNDHCLALVNTYFSDRVIYTEFLLFWTMGGNYIIFCIFPSFINSGISKCSNEITGGGRVFLNDFKGLL